MLNYEIAPYANLLVYKKEYSPQTVKDIIEKNKLDGLRIFVQFKDQLLGNYEFLKEFNFLKRLDIDSMEDPDLNLLNFLTNLKSLSIGMPGKTSIDLSNLVNLENLSILWRPKIAGMVKCQKLKRLSIMEHKENNLINFTGLPNLEGLVIKHSTIKSLEGITSMVKLINLFLGACRNLTSIKELSNLKNLKEVRLNGCPKINELSPLSNLKNMDILELTDCRNISSIKFIKKIPSLKRLVIAGNTLVEDGDVKPAFHIQDLIYRHRNQYNSRVESSS